jgi:hypothetical protein
MSDMGMLTNMLLLMFCISFFLYLGGYQSGLLMMLTDWKGGGIGSDALMTNLMAALMAGFLSAFVAGVASNAASGSQSVIFTIPAGFVSGFLGAFMLLPMSFIFEPAMPDVVKIFLGGFLYITLIGTIISFIRGGDY